MLSANITAKFITRTCEQHSKSQSAPVKSQMVQKSASIPPTLYQMQQEIFTHFVFGTFKTVDKCLANIIKLHANIASSKCQVV